MIRVAPIPDDLTPLENYALTLLLDASGLLRVTDASAPVVELVIEGGQGATPGGWLQAGEGRVTLARKAGPRDLRQQGGALGRRRRERGLLRGERHANPLAMQPPDCSGYLEHLSDRTGSVLHEGDFIGSERQGFGFQDGLGRAWQDRRERDQHRRKDTHVCCPPAGGNNNNPTA